MSGATPQTLLIAALGGEGGGVLAEWLVQVAQQSGYAVQATSVPGVAQRTGATSYYLEWLPPDAAATQAATATAVGAVLPLAPDAPRPVFALMPVPGRVDILLSSELLESTRLLERGFIAPDRTLLITATHRVLTTAEKMAMGDGRADSMRLLAALEHGAQHCLALDLQAITARHRTVISAVLFGALAGSGRLPFARRLCEDVIRAGGLGVEASLAGFAEAFAAAQPGVASASGAGVSRSVTSLIDPPKPFNLTDLRAVQALGEARLTDYQNAAYAQRYAQRVASLAAAAPDTPEALATLAEAARHLALWMSYEDVVRVADLKARPERLARVRAEAQAGAGDVVEIREHLKPGLEELAAIAPVRIGLALRARARRPGATASKPLTLHTTSIRGFVLLKLLASLKRWRPISLRFAEEQAAIDDWLAALQQALPRHAGFAAALAGLPRLRKGYSDTFERGRAAYERIVAACVGPALAGQASPSDAQDTALRQAIQAALADPEHQALSRQLSAMGAAPPAAAAAAQPIRIHPRVSRQAGTPTANR